MGVRIAEKMTKNFKIVEIGQSAEEARKLLSANDNKAIFVTQNNRLVGIISRTDVLKKYSPDLKVEDIMTSDVVCILPNQTIQEAAHIFTEKKFSSLPVVDKDRRILGIITTEDIIKDIMKEEEEKMSVEVMAIHLAMTKNRELEEYWLQKAQENGYKAVITQVGANAEKLAIKMRESAIVAAIAKGVIREDPREKIAVSNAVRDVYAQLNLINPGLGGGFKIAVVSGSGRVTVAAFGRCGHALANGPEQLVIGFSII